MVKNKILSQPLIIALDTDSPDRALELAQELQDFAGSFKIGPRLSLAGGPRFIQKIADLAPVFLDHKFFDIPSTMCASLEAAFDSGVTLATIHLMSGQVALEKVVALEARLNQSRPFQVLGVSILTSWTEQDPPPIFAEETNASRVNKLILFGKKNGLSGFVCSGHELEPLQELNISNQTGDFLVVPGIRRKKDKL